MPTFFSFPFPQFPFFSAQFYSSKQDILYLFFSFSSYSLHPTKKSYMQGKAIVCWPLIAGPKKLFEQFVTLSNILCIEYKSKLKLLIENFQLMTWLMRKYQKQKYWNINLLLLYLRIHIFTIPRVIHACVGFNKFGNLINEKQHINLTTTIHIAFFLLLLLLLVILIKRSIFLSLIAQYVTKIRQMGKF